MVPVVIVAIAVVAFGVQSARAAQVKYFDVPNGAHPHDVAPAPDGNVWYTAQSQGALGILDPKTGKVTQVSLGSGAAPHTVRAHGVRARSTRRTPVGCCRGRVMLLK